MKPCNNPECCSSTGICDTLTNGTGELDRNGYWEFPCHVCDAFFSRKSTMKFFTELSMYLERNYRLIAGNTNLMFLVYKKEYKWGQSDYRVVEWCNGRAVIKKICEY